MAENRVLNFSLKLGDQHFCCLCKVVSRTSYFLHAYVNRCLLVRLNRLLQVYTVLLQIVYILIELSNGIPYRFIDN